jgi:hypothetical protein
VRFLYRSFNFFLLPRFVVAAENDMSAAWREWTLRFENDSEFSGDDGYTSGHYAALRSEAASQPAALPFGSVLAPTVNRLPGACPE